MGHLTPLTPKSFVGVEANFQVIKLFILFENVIFIIGEVDRVRGESIRNVKIRESIDIHIQLIIVDGVESNHPKKLIPLN